MPTKHFTDRWLQSVRADRRVEYWDDSVRGFGLRVTPDRCRTFFLRTRFAGRRLRIPLGRYPEIPLTKAREKARIVLGQVADGIDPTRPKGILFGELAEAWATDARRQGRLSTEHQRLLDKDLIPRWRNRPAAGIKRADTLELLAEVQDRATGSRPNREIARKVRGVIARIFDYGILVEAVEHNPTHLVPAYSSRPRTRVLTLDEISTLWPVWSADYPAGAVYQLILLTAQRPGEVGGLRWTDISEDSWWTLPAHFTKSDRPNHVYLTQPARQIIRCQQEGKSEWVFPGPDGPFGPLKAAQRRYRRQLPELADWRPHDLRRTTATHLGGLGIASNVIESILNHSPSTVAERHYNLYRYDRESQEALTLWANHLGRCRVFE